MANETTEKTSRKAPANWRDLPAISVKVDAKECGKCKRTLPAKDFWKMRTSKDGLQPQCKDCQLGTPLGTNAGKDGSTPAPKHDQKHTKQTPAEKPSKSEKKDKPARKSRAAAIGSGRRKECVGCTYQIKSTEGGRCISADAENDPEKDAKGKCKHLVQSKTAKKAAKKAKKE